MVTYYKSWRIGKDGKPGWRIVDETGKIVNISPKKDELEGLEDENCRKKKNERYTDEQLLNYLRKFFKENGRSPTQLDFIGNLEYPSHMTYGRRLGGWNKAIEKAGLYVNYCTKLSDEELLNYLRKFFKENGRAPTLLDFNCSLEYPSFGTYKNRFGNWNKVLMLVGLDIDTMVKQGIIKNNQQKGRLWELSVIEHFENRPEDLSGENYHSSCDGICPNGKIYEAKSAALVNDLYWSFGCGNKYKEEIEIYYFGAFSSDWSKLEHAWRVPGEFVEGYSFRIGIYGGEFTVENMKEYEITDKFDKI